MDQLPCRRQGRKRSPVRQGLGEPAKVPPSSFLEPPHEVYAPPSRPADLGADIQSRRRMAVNRKLRAIFFDIDDTLFSTSEFADKARRAAIDAMIAHGLLGEREAVVRELNEVVAEFTSNYEHHLDKLLLRLPQEALNGRNPAIFVAAGV